MHNSIGIAFDGITPVTLTIKGFYIFYKRLLLKVFINHILCNIQSKNRNHVHMTHAITKLNIFDTNFSYLPFFAGNLLLVTKFIKEYCIEFFFFQDFNNTFKSVQQQQQQKDDRSSSFKYR